jgi:hypothetical protein
MLTFKNQFSLNTMDSKYNANVIIKNSKDEFATTQSLNQAYKNMIIKFNLSFLMINKVLNTL